MTETPTPAQDRTDDSELRFNAQQVRAKDSGELTAVQWTGSIDLTRAVIGWIVMCGGRIEFVMPGADHPGRRVNESPRPAFLVLGNKVGAHRVDIGDWILRGATGMFFPVAAERYVRDYEPIPDPPPSDGIAGVQRWMTADLWSSLGLDDDCSSYMDRNGFGTTWAVLLGRVRDAAQGVVPCTAEECVLRSGHVGPHYSAGDVGTHEPLPGARIVWPPDSADTPERAAGDDTAPRIDTTSLVVSAVEALDGDR